MSFFLFFPNKLRPQLMIEVDEHGQCLRCLKRDFTSGEWVPGEESLLTPELKEAIEEDIAAARWDWEPSSGVEILWEGLKPV